MKNTIAKNLFVSLSENKFFTSFASWRRRRVPIFILSRNFLMLSTRRFSAAVDDVLLGTIIFIVACLIESLLLLFFLRSLDFSYSVFLLCFFSREIRSLAKQPVEWL